VIATGQELSGRLAVSLPVIIKPAYEGSSKAYASLPLAHNVRQAQDEVSFAYWRNTASRYGRRVAGEEITIGVSATRRARAGIMRRAERKKSISSIPGSKADYVNLVDYECPAALARDVLEKLEESSLMAFRALGCRDFARVDYRVSRDGTPYFIEINPLPGLGTYSDLVIMATMLGWTHQGLIRAVFDAALTRYPQCVGV
jgi:D-alanine-D-alanine ligase